MDPLFDLKPGTTFDGLRIEALLGAGGMGAVYKAVDTGLDRPVAVKFLTSARDRAASVERFRREAVAVAKCSHPGIVQVYSWGDFEGTPYFTMEYVDGAPLSVFLQRGRMLRNKSPREVEALVAAGYLRPDPALPYFLRDPSRDPIDDPEHLVETAALVASIADALSVAHAQGIVHRDLKPTNLMMTRAGAPKIVDFGLALRSSATDLTASEQILGTLRYMAPEQFQPNRERIGARTDLYSLGVVLYELATFVHPVEDAEMPAIVGQILNTTPAAPSVYNPRIPRPLVRVIERCLAKDPADRFPSAEALADELRLAAEARGLGLRALYSFFRSSGARPAERGGEGHAARGAVGEGGAGGTAGAGRGSAGAGAAGAGAAGTTAGAGKPDRGTAGAGWTGAAGPPDPGTAGAKTAGAGATGFAAVAGAAAPEASAVSLLEEPARVFRRTLDVEAALPQLEAVLAARPYLVPGHLFLLEIQEFLEDEDAGLEIVRGLHENSSRFGESGRLLAGAVACLREEDPEGARALIRRHNRGFPFVPWLAWPEIEVTLATGDAARAREMIGNLLRQRPDEALFRWYAARFFLLREQLDAAQSALENSISAPGMHWLRLPAARLALDRWDVAAARNHVDRLREERRTHPAVLDVEMRVSLAEGDVSRAVRAARERVSVAAEGMEKARAYAWLARLARLDQRPNEADRYDEIARRLGAPERAAEQAADRWPHDAETAAVPGPDGTMPELGGAMPRSGGAVPGPGEAATASTAVVLRLLRAELQRAARERPWCAPAVHASHFALSPSGPAMRTEFLVRRNDLLTPSRALRVRLREKPPAPFTTLAGEPVDARYVSFGSGPLPFRARLRLPREAAPEEEMIVRTAFVTALPEAGELRLPPDDEPAAIPETRLILVQLPHAAGRAGGDSRAVPDGPVASPAPDETIDLPESRLLVFRRQLRRGDAFAVTLAHRSA